MMASKIIRFTSLSQPNWFRSISRLPSGRSIVLFGFKNVLYISKTIYLVLAISYMIVNCSENIWVIQSTWNFFFKSSAALDLWCSRLLWRNDLLKKTTFLCSHRRFIWTYFKISTPIFSSKLSNGATLWKCLCVINEIILNIIISKKVI